MEITTLMETDDRTVLRSWMEKNHQKEREVWVATYRGRQPMAGACRMWRSWKRRSASDG